MPASYREVLSATPSRYRLRITFAVGQLKDFAASSQDDFIVRVAQSLPEGTETQTDNKYPDAQDRHLDGIRKRGCIGGKRRKNHAEEKIRRLGGFIRAQRWENSARHA